MDIVILTGWIGGMFGLRVSNADRKLFFGLKGGDTITLELPDPTTEVYAEIPPGFWGSCPELRANEIGCWMCKRGDWPWPKSHPPKYRAEIVKPDFVRILGSEQDDK